MLCVDVGFGKTFKIWVETNVMSIISTKHKRLHGGLGRNNPVHLFLRGKGLGIQQGTSVWVGSPKSYTEDVESTKSLSLFLENLELRAPHPKNI